jgi:DNA-binding transcriptional ArsR family regulator
MSEPFEELADLDKLVHEPARLAILTGLSACQAADFRFLQRLTGLSKGNLSSHLAKLEAGGLVTIRKQFVGRVPNTTVELSGPGREAVERHWERLERLRDQASHWRPPADAGQGPARSGPQVDSRRPKKTR